MPSEEFGDASVETVSEKVKLTDDDNKQNETIAKKAATDGETGQKKGAEGVPGIKKAAGAQGTKGAEGVNGGEGVKKANGTRAEVAVAPGRTYLRPAGEGGSDGTTAKSPPAATKAAAVAAKVATATSEQKKSSDASKVEKKTGDKSKVEKQAVSDSSKKETASDSSKKETASDSSKKETASDSGKKETASDSGKKETASDSGKQEKARAPADVVDAEIFAAPPDPRVSEEKLAADVVDLRSSDFGEKLPAATSSSSNSGSVPETRRYYRYSTYNNG